MQTLAFWLVKFFLKLHSAASIFGIDKERVELLLLVSPFRSAHPSKFYQHSHYFVSSFFTFFILSRGSSPYIPITTWHPPSTYFFYFFFLKTTTRGRQRHLRMPHSSAAVLEKNQKYICSRTEGFQSQLLSHRLSATSLAAPGLYLSQPVSFVGSSAG